MFCQIYLFLSRTKTCSRKKISHIVQCRCKSMKKYELQDMFSEEESSKILAKLNNASQRELLEYPAVTDSMAGTLVTERHVKPFTSLDQLLDFKGFGPKRILYLGQNVLQNTKRKDKQQRNKSDSSKKNIYPPYIGKGAPGSVIALNLKLPQLFWIHMNKDFTIKDLGVTSVIKEGMFDHVLVQNQIWGFINGLPKTDAYLMEEFIVNPKYLPYLVTSMKTETTLVALLNCAAMLNAAKQEGYTCEGTDTYIQQRVHKIKPSFLLRYFNVSIGGERQSVRDIIQQLLNSNYRGIPVTCDHAIRMKYLQLKSMEQEHMGSCLLQAVLFYKFLQDGRWDSGISDSSQDLSEDYSEAESDT